MPSKSTQNTHSPVSPRLLRAMGSTGSILAFVGALMLSASAHSADPIPKSKHATTAPQAKKKGSLKVKHQLRSSEETTVERDRRLTRECKGAPNAGACMGYTRK